MTWNRKQRADCRDCPVAGEIEVQVNGRGRKEQACAGNPEQQPRRRERLSPGHGPHPIDDCAHDPYHGKTPP